MVTRSGSNDATTGPAFSAGAIVKGTSLSFVVTLISAVLLGLAVALTEWEGVSRGLDWFTYVSIGLGGMWAARETRRLGWLNGGVVGLLYYVVSSLLFHGDFSIQQMAAATWYVGALWSYLAGAVGGMIGVNV